MSGSENFNKLDVLVVGAGPVGIFAANELKRHGLSCRLIDKKGELSDKSKALALHVRSLEMFEQVGLIEPILRECHKVKGMQIKVDGKVLLQNSFERLDSAYRFIAMLSQDRTERILYQALLAKGGDIEWHSDLEQLQQFSDHVVATVKVNQTQTEQITASWVLACDGAHSKLRELLQVEFPGGDYAAYWWLADIDVEWDVSREVLAIYPSEEGPLACFPMAGGRRYRMVLLAPPGAPHRDPTLEEVQQAIIKRSGEAVKLGEVHWLTGFYLHHRQIQHYQHGRVFFAGDAAHIHSPFGGQGLNTGLQDAFNLGWKLALVQKQLARPELLASYHVERHSVGREVVVGTDVLTKVATLESPVAMFLRNQILQVVNSLDFVKEKMVSKVSELTINYRKSAIVTAHCHHTQPTGGDLAPDAPIVNAANQADSKLHQIFQNTHHQLLVFTGDDLTTADKIVKALPAALEKYAQVIKPHLILSETALNAKLTWQGSMLEDKAHFAHERYQVKHAALYLIRPDGYIGFVSNPANLEQLTSYLAKIFI